MLVFLGNRFKCSRRHEEPLNEVDGEKIIFPAYKWTITSYETEKLFKTEKYFLFKW